MSDLKHIFVVIPAYNESQAIAPVVESVKKQNFHVVVIDDSSSDQTGEFAQQAGAHVITHIINRGQGAALQTGIQYAVANGADIIVTFDADGQHDASQISSLTAPIERGEVDVVLGSRFLNGVPGNMPFLRSVVLRAGVLFTRVFSQIPITDTHNGLRAFSVDSARKIQIKQDRMSHASEIFDEIKKHKLSFVEVPVLVSYSDYSLKKGQKSIDAIKIAVKFLLGKFIK